MEIVDFPNYLIYKDGKVQNKKSKRYLRPAKHNGYYRVGLSKNGKLKSHLVHRLIALHYIENHENKPQVDHINRDRSDNRIENLRWVDNSENGQNQGNYKTNTSGHKNISYNKTKKKYVYIKIIRGKRHQRHLNTLTEALCYKYIFQLKIKSGIV